MFVNVILDSSQLRYIRTDQLTNGRISVYSNKSVINEGKLIRFQYPIKLEMHLGDSEVVAIPVIPKGDTKINIKSFSLNKPLQGTQLKFNFILSTTGNITEDEYLFDLVFMSKQYWNLYTKKLHDGVRSNKIDFTLEFPGHVGRYYTSDKLVSMSTVIGEVEGLPLYAINHETSRLG